MIEKVKSLIPFEEIEEEAILQINNASSKPFLKQMAIMPDCHTGYDLPIGGVALLENVISPSYVGYDIGCGVCMEKTTIPASDVTPEILQYVYDRILELVPVGEGRESSIEREFEEFSSASGNKELNDKVNSKLIKQLGTLGGENHFIELGISDKDQVLTVIIHSGSRNPGHSVGGYYMGVDSNVMEGEKGLFLFDSEIGQAYFKDMKFMMNYAMENRIIMLDIICDKVLSKVFGKKWLSFIATELSDYDNEDIVDTVHNYALHTEEGILHRKGAISAYTGELGVIPSNMQHGTYFVVGTGNMEYLYSASHGAGRKMSRSKARKTIEHSTFVEQMSGIVSSTDVALIDEAPDAYKNPKRVMELQDGININILDHITPVLNIKGSSSRFRK